MEKKEVSGKNGKAKWRGRKKFLGRMEKRDSKEDRSFLKKSRRGADEAGITLENGKAKDKQERKESRCMEFGW